STENRMMLWVPPGCGHGFYVISDVAEMVYKCTDYYAPEHEHTIRWDDPDLGIADDVETVAAARRHPQHHSVLRRQPETRPSAESR
ncbi:MAG: dTDP-4-dehydrorhamnose 3,5-epimerase family protein, partial [Deltaproteobacteria bacterium]